MSDVIKVIDKTESVLESVFKDVVSFSFLIFCIWLSQGSRWWTFVTGLLFLTALFIRCAVVLKQRSKIFKSKKELLEWANNLEWPEK